MLCYRCGSHVPDTSDTCPTCGSKYDASARQASGASTRKRGSVEGAPYKPGDTIAGRYTVRDLLGAGPVGYVFRVQDQTHEVDVALKIINPRLLQEPEERTQFSLVLKVGKKLNHAYLLRVYDEGFDQERPFFTTQVVEGMTLRRMMEMRAARGQPFTLKEVEPLLSQLADALDAAHRYGPHSNLKPENVIVLPDVLKVADYGLALGIPRLPFVQAQKGYRVDGYIAPEYVSGGEIDTRMDIYSLAVIVGEMLTGLMPDGDGIPELLLKNPELPPAFEGLYRRALNANPLARPKTAGEFASEFAAIVSKGSSTMNRQVQPAPPVAGSALAATARQSAKPPPPVPTDQLPIASVSPPVVARPPVQSEEPPADATQPMDAEMLAAIMAAPPSTVLKPGGLGKAAESRAGKPSAAESPSMPPPPVPTGNLPTLPQPAVAAARPAAKPAAAPRPRRKVEKRPLPMVWLVLLTVAGLAMGSVLGYLWLKRRGPARLEDVSPVTRLGPGPNQQPVPPVAPAGAGDDSIAPAGSCPAGMRLVSGGAFKMGAAANDPQRSYDEHLLMSVQVASYCIDEYEYPNQPGALPAVNVDWSEAALACENLKKRLCTEAEWEKACKGPGSARFPYGEPYSADLCNTSDAAGKARPLSESGRFERCRSGYGVADLSGNVAEWTASQFENSTRNMAQKGGAFQDGSHAVRCSARKSGVPMAKEPSVGFRCCAGVQP